MLNEKERLFLQYWEANREREAQWQFQLITGIPIGLLFALPIIGIIFTAKFWYQRADMVSTTMVSPFILILAVLLIAVFIAIFYKRYLWDRKEQQYQQLKARNDLDKKNEPLP